ncbi:MAG: AraC family transcriptional regulator [Lentisphaeria bacterium]
MLTYFYKDLASLEFPPVMIRDTYQDDGAVFHKHDYVEIALVRQGHSVHRIQSAGGAVLENSIIKGDVFTVLPGEVHSYVKCKHYRVYNVCLAPSFLLDEWESLSKLKHFDAFFNSTRNFNVNQLHLVPVDFLYAELCLKRIWMAQNSSGQSRRLALKISLMDFLLTVFDSSSTPWKKTETKVDETLFLSISNLENHPERPFDLKRITRKAGMSVSGYIQKFKHVVGIPPGEYSIRLRLDMSRKLLETSYLQLADIAQKCGFCDTNYLIRLFKRRFGITPGKYRAHYNLISRLT